MTSLTSKIDTHDKDIKSAITTSQNTITNAINGVKNDITQQETSLKNVINAKGCIKSVQIINQWITLTIDNDIGMIQANINQVDASKSIVLFNDIKWYILNPGDSTIKNLKRDNSNFELDSIESRCVKFRYHCIEGSKPSSKTYHVVFQLVEFY